MLYKLQFGICIMMLVSITFVSHTAALAQDEIATPVLPNIINVPLGSTPLTPTSDETLFPSGTQLPQAITATPTPTPLPPPSEHPLLDAAGTNTLAASSFAFSINGELIVETETESGSVRFSTTGTIAHFNAFQTLELQHITRLSISLGDQQEEFVVEQRIINGTFYMRGEYPKTGEQTSWYAIPLANILEETFPFESVLALLENQTGQVDPETENIILQIFTLGKYAETKNRGESGSEVHFETELEIAKFLRSKKDLSLLVTLLARLGDVDLDQDTVESTIQIFQMAVPYFVPEVELTLDQYVLQGVKPVISRLEIAFDLETTLLGENPLSMSGDTTAIEVDVVAALSGYDGVYVIEIPADAISVSSVSDIKP